MLTEIQKVRLLIGDTDTSLYYPILKDEEIEFIIYRYGSDGKYNNQVVKVAARSALLQITQAPTKEYVGETELWNQFASEYRKALDFILRDSYILPDGLMPYFAGIDWDDVCTYLDDSTLYVDPLKRLAACNAKKTCGDC